MTTVTNKNGIEFDIDAIATDLNNKVDLDGTNATYPHVVSRTANSNGEIVEIWSDGYCVQTGIINSPSSESYNVAVTFLQNYKDTNYVVTTTYCNQAGTYTSGTATANYNVAHAYGASINTRSISGFRINCMFAQTNATRQIMWRAEGYIR